MRPCQGQPVAKQWQCCLATYNVVNTVLCNPYPLYALLSMMAWLKKTLHIAMAVGITKALLVTPNVCACMWCSDRFRHWESMWCMAIPIFFPFSLLLFIRRTRFNFSCITRSFVGASSSVFFMAFSLQCNMVAICTLHTRMESFGAIGEMITPDSNFAYTVKGCQTILDERLDLRPTCDYFHW